MEGVDRRAVVLDPSHAVVHRDPQEVGHSPSSSHRCPTLEVGPSMTASTARTHRGGRATVASHRLHARLTRPCAFVPSRPSDTTKWESSHPLSGETTADRPNPSPAGETFGTA